MIINMIIIIWWLYICYFIFVLSNHIKQTFFGQKTPKQDPPPPNKKKKNHQSVLNLYAALTLDNTCKTTFSATFGLKYLKTIFIKKKTIYINLRLHVAVTLCKKIKQIQRLIFHNIWKTSICALFGTFWH